MHNSLQTSSAINLRILFYSTLPLGLSFATKHIMIVIDRIILSYYSIDAMNVASFTSIAVHWISGPLAAFTSSAVILVGKYNGAQEYNKVATAVWQMIFLSFASSILYIVATLGLDLFSFPIFFTQHMMYAKLLMLSGFLDPLIAALSAFYIGIGERLIIGTSYIISNVMNVVLAIILVFGIKGFIPELGANGAAIATIIAEAIQAVILFAGFLSKKHIKLYATNICSFNKKVFISCISIGSTSALLTYFEITGFLLISYVNTLMGPTHATVYNVSLNVFLTFAFFIGAIEKSTTSFASNLIGKKDFFLFPKLFRSSIALTCIFCFVLLSPLVLFPKIFLGFLQFQGLQQEGLSIMSVEIITSCRYLWIYLLFRCISLTIRGLLLAFNDLRFSIYSTGITIVLTVGPIVYYFLFLKPLFKPHTNWQILCVYTFVSIILFYLRYVSIFKRIKSK